MQYARNKSPLNKTTKNAFKTRKVVRSKSRDFTKKPQLFNMNILKAVHKEAELDLNKGLIDDALLKFLQCIDEYFSAVNEDPKSAGFSEYFYTTIKMLNENALRLLKENKVEESLLILAAGRELMDGKRFGEYPTMSCLNYNHMACWYRRDGKLLVALKYLEKAMEALLGTEEHEYFGMTHLNLCAIHSQMGK